MKNILFYTVKSIIGLQKILGKGGGTSYAGQFALNRNPRLFRSFTLPEQRVFISGTNGKTSTANALGEIFEKSGEVVCRNKQGANMEQGIATTLFKCCRKPYQVDADRMIMEIDELNMLLVFPHLPPSEILLTNLFNDQTDRYGDKWQLAKTLSQNLPCGITLYINGDDPALVWLSRELKPIKTICFGIKRGTLPMQYRQHSYTETCPYCGRPLRYEEQYYESLGKFACDCGFKSPELDYEASFAENPLSGLNQFSVDARQYKMPQQQLYFAYNMLAAICYASEKNIESSLIADVLGKRIEVAGRFEHLPFNHYDAWLNLVKNPAGLNQSLDYLEREIKNAESEKRKVQLLLAFNNQLADGVDGSWLERGQFSVLNEEAVEKIYVTGELKDELTDLLTDRFGLGEKVVMIEKADGGVSAMKKSNQQCYFLVNFSALNNLRNLIAE